MTESPLEVQRRLHEERERIICAMVRESLRIKNSYKERVNSEHRLKVFVDQYLESTLRLKDVYVDEDGLRKAEINAVSGPNEFAEFYTRFRRLKEAHRNAPNEIVVPLSVEFQRFTENGNDLYQNDADLVEFTDEEGYGRFLDLHECYDKFINLKGVERVDYITYINTFDDVQSIPKSKKNAEYRAYLGFLMDYLVDVIARVKPLLDISEDLVKAEQEFENQWEEGTFPGWPKESVSALSHSGAFLDLSPFQTVEELKTVGLNRLKSALMALGLKCGGTLDERAQRLFSTKGKTANEIDSSLFAKTSAAEQMKRERDRQKEIAKMEAQLAYFAQQVEDLRKATRENVERKQARVFGEYEEDEEEIGNISDEQEEEDIPYNPKNLPLGWDGKPIPYWLYKLHGLNLSFPCEICGNQVYKGPKAFQKHFSEWRHAHGMRCLGIPNTAHFANITSISDALDLWNKLREEKESVRFKAEVEEEYEDSLGNVVNKKTYEDLRRQGLL